MRLLVDTGVFSAALSRKRRPQFESLVARLPGNQLNLAAQSVGELRYGALLADWGTARTDRLELAIAGDGSPGGGRGLHPTSWRTRPVKVRAVVAGSGVVALTAGLVYAAPSVTTLRRVRRLTPRLAGRGRPDHVALTFDDGPDAASTPFFLDLLAELGVHATFFVLGEQVAGHRGVARRLIEEGHQVGLHGWDHRNSLLTTPWALRANIARGLDEVVATTGVRPDLYRPPHGIASAGAFWAARDLGLTPVLWDAWGRDWTPDATAAHIVRTVRRDVRGGSTVLLHDSDCRSTPGSWRATLGALDPLIAGLRDDGLEVGPLRDHAVGRG